LTLHTEETLKKKSDKIEIQLQVLCSGWIIDSGLLCNIIWK